MSQSWPKDRTCLPYPPRAGKVNSKYTWWAVIHWLTSIILDLHSGWLAIDYLQRSPKAVGKGKWGKQMVTEAPSLTHNCLGLPMCHALESQNLDDDWELRCSLLWWFTGPSNPFFAAAHAWSLRLAWALREGPPYTWLWLLENSFWYLAPCAPSWLTKKVSDWTMILAPSICHLGTSKLFSISLGVGATKGSGLLEQHPHHHPVPSLTLTLPFLFLHTDLLDIQWPRQDAWGVATITRSMVFLEHTTLLWM